MTPYSHPPMPEEELAPLLDADGHLYVFGYGSLIWKPGFAHASRHPALLRGFHRRFCIWSRHYRGTPERPGLVLGLQKGGGPAGAPSSGCRRPRRALPWPISTSGRCWAASMCAASCPCGCSMPRRVRA